MLGNIKLGSVGRTMMQSPIQGSCRRAVRLSTIRSMPSAFHNSSPPPASIPLPRSKPEYRRSTICQSQTYVLQGASNPNKPSGRRQLSDVIDDFINLPWQKIASWASVALLASQLKDFLGVRSWDDHHHQCPTFSKS